MNKKSNTDELILNIIQRIDQVQRSNINPIRKIAIFSTPRSGGTYFCDLLSQTKIMGEPREWFNERFIRAYGRYFNKKNINLNEYVNYIYDKTTSESGIFSIKILAQQYLFFLKEKKFDLLSLGFDDIIFVSRRDKIAQAYSFTKASMTDQWTSNTNTLVEQKRINFKNSDILKNLCKIALWEEFFELHMSSKINLNYMYEDFIKQRNFPYDVLKDLNLSVSAQVNFDSQLQKQTTQNDLLIIEKFRKSLNLL